MRSDQNEIHLKNEERNEIRNTLFFKLISALFSVKSFTIAR